MRNFWINAVIDGRKTPLKGGPRSKKGGFIIEISQRDKGKETTPIKIVGRLSPCGKSLGVTLQVNTKKHTNWTQL